MVTQGEIWWANLPDPHGSESGFRRPVIIVQQSAINQSMIRTVICVPLTTNMRLVNAPGNVLMPIRHTGLPKESVANVSQIIALDKRFLSQYVQTVPAKLLNQVLNGIEFMLGR
jgi:mRNA interferase MazF